MKEEISAPAPNPAGEHVTFSFGANWLEFSKDLDEAQYEASRRSLVRLLQLDSLEGLSVLDIGSGSGLFSLAAVALGAREVVSADVDRNSVRASERMREKLNAPHWKVVNGSVLDEAFIRSLGTFDIVYSWGVLHHTGSMWRAIENAAGRVKPGGRFAISIYNKILTSAFWLAFKRRYNRVGPLAKNAMALSVFLPRAAVRLARGRNPIRGDRGMSIWYDAVDWAGGLPYEYATFDEIAAFVGGRGFTLLGGTRTKLTGCNEFLFRRGSA